MLTPVKNLIFGDSNENPNFTSRLSELELNWAETLDQLDVLLDTDVTGLVTLCQDLDGTSKLNKKYKTYTLPVSEVLPDHTQRILMNRNWERLAQVYHNLQADSQDQKHALQNGQIILSPWELLCFTLFKALASPSLTCPHLAMQCFYDEANESGNNLSDYDIDQAFYKMRMDKHRMLVILMSRLHRKLII